MKADFLRDLLGAKRSTRAARLGEATAIIQRLLHDRLGGGHIRPHGRPAPAAAPKHEDAGAFLSASFANAAGTRPYRLYVPSGYRGQLVPLVVMLHGCTQSPEDFAAGTRMNQAAEAQIFLVVYPGQTQSANSSKCWNWFRTEDQQRNHGEASLLAGITREVMGAYAVDPARVYVAGMSAGGAAAAILGDAYPDLFAAIGVHSGLACGVAHDLNSAFAAMRGSAPTPRRDGRNAVPTIVFHGDQDSTVNPRNGDAVIEQATPEGALERRAMSGRVTGGHAYDVTRHLDAAGRSVMEQWVVHGSGHAWSGGSEAGSFTDAKGPDATAEMLRFFRQHRRPAG